MAQGCLAYNQIIPPSTRQLLQIGPLPQPVYAACREQAQTVLSLEGDDTDLYPDTLANTVDAAILSLRSQDLARLEPLLAKIKSVLNPDGRVTILWEEFDQPPWFQPHLDDILSKTGWIRYQEGHLPPYEDTFQIWGTVLTRQTYNPITHARALAASDRPDLALAILADIPESLFESDENLALLALEKQRLYLRWQQLVQGHTSNHAYFSKERREFAQVTTLFPTLQESYHVHSRFWLQIGRQDMAIRTLNSIEHVAPDAKTRHLLQIQLNQPRPFSMPSSVAPTGARWQSGMPIPRILFITHGTSDYGQDTLFHGLRTILGDENVVDFPWKSTLHGQDLVTANNYPCVFNYPEQPLSVDELVAQLQAGFFDFIVFADVIGMNDREQVLRLLNAAPHLPIILYDSWDDCHTPLDAILKYIGRPKVDIIFKREMLDGIDYGPQTFPLPFAYPESLGSVCLPLDQRSCNPPFWAGRNEFGLRPLYVYQLERITGQPMNTRFEQHTYRQRLRSSLIGLSFFGVGFDTVRYWEIPANGVMLLAERPPICIPNNFEDDISAVFFDTVLELEAKLRYYQNHPDKAAEIAANGHNHYLKHHTTTERARYFLGTIYQQLPIG